VLGQPSARPAQTQATNDDLGRQITATLVERTPANAAYTTALAYDTAGNLNLLDRPTRQHHLLHLRRREGGHQDHRPARLGVFAHKRHCR